MSAVNGPSVGAIYGTASATDFEIAVRDSTLERLEYIQVEHQGHNVLAMVDEVRLHSDLSFEEAHAGAEAHGSRYEAHASVLGMVDDRGNLQLPRTPLLPGQNVYRASEDLILKALGLEQGGSGALLGRLKGPNLPVQLDMNTLAQKHVSVLAKTGAGKSYTVGVLLESFMLAGVPLVILDPHGEYGSLRRANTDKNDLRTLKELGLKPKAFQQSVQEYAVDTQVVRGATKLVLDGNNLDAQEIGALLPQKLQSSQMGVLFQAVRDTEERMPSYGLEDVRESAELNKSNAKWTVISAIDALLGTGLFGARGTKIQDLVRPGQATIINLKGVSPDLQEIVAAQLSERLWQGRKRGDIPPHLLVVEEAHNFCPERGIGSAMSGPILRTIAAEGRKFGLGLFIISQRPAKIDKNVLSQCNTQVVLKVTNPNDLKAIIASVEGITSRAADEIQRLNIGTALVAGGGVTQPVLVHVRPRITRHGGDSVDIVGPTAAPKTDIIVDDEPPKRLAKPKPAPEPIMREAPVRRAVETAPAPRKEPETPREDPIQRAMKRVQSRGVLQEPASAPKSEFDLVGVHRVAKRVGLVQGDSVEQTAHQLRKWAADQGVPQDHWLKLYTQISEVACHVGEPHCIQCPLRERCQDHQVRQDQRSRKGLRRLWGG